MTHTGTGDKCSKWERGETVDKPAGGKGQKWGGGKSVR